MPPLASRRSPLATLKSQFGCWLHERRQAEAVLSLGIGSWLDLCNRHERVTVDPVSQGRICQWRDSSQLTLSRVFPRLGARLLDHCLRKWPIHFNYDSAFESHSKPDASLLIAMGGKDRIAQFQAVLASLRGQSHRSMEIVVVEQSEVPEVREMLPPGIRYFHDVQASGVEFNKSRALNRAAREAKGKYFLIHDADYVVPMSYVEECCRVLTQAHGVRPSRMNFHLDKESTRFITEQRTIPTSATSEYIVQNNPTPMALRAESYWELGGHDESFIGWGGEDVEFLSRLRTLSMAEGGWMPTIHLWHPPAPRKASGHRNQQQQDQLLNEDPSVRIARLRKQAERASGAIAI